MPAVTQQTYSGTVPVSNGTGGNGNFLNDFLANTTGQQYNAPLFTSTNGMQAQSATTPPQQQAQQGGYSQSNYNGGLNGNRGNNGGNQGFGANWNTNGNVCITPPCKPSGFDLLMCAVVGVLAIILVVVALER